MIGLSGRLAAVDSRYADWASAVGVPVGSLLEPVARDEALAELDALSALSFGLSERQLQYVFETFPSGLGSFAAVGQSARPVPSLEGNDVTGQFPPVFATNRARRWCHGCGRDQPPACDAAPRVRLSTVRSDCHCLFEPRWVLIVG